MILGYNPNQISSGILLGTETTDPDLEATQFSTSRIVVSNKDTIHKTLRDTGVTNVYACITHSVTRGGVDLPV